MSVMIANLALDAAGRGYENDDIRFAVRMASHVYDEEMVREFFERWFPSQWPSPLATKRAKKAAKRRRYRANRAAARKAAAAGTSVFDYAQSEAADDIQTERLIGALASLAQAEEEYDCDCGCEDEDETSLPDVQKLTYKDATTQSSVVRLKDGRVMEVRRNELTGAAIPDRQFWPSAEAWRASLPDPHAQFDEDGVHVAADAVTKDRIQLIRERLQRLKEKASTAD
jgi:hypothetical protein